MIWRTLYPLLFVVYPILFLYAQNQEEALIRDLLEPAAAVLFLALLIFGVALLATRSVVRSAALVAIALFMIFSYGHVATILRGLTIKGYIIGRGLVVLPLWTLLLLSVLWWVGRTRRDLQKLTEFLALLGVLLVSMTLVQIALHEFRPRQAADRLWKEDVQRWVSEQKADPGEDGLRDIYYIILDEYAGAQMLAGRFKYDNSPFLDSLRRRGFYIGDKSSSNYMFTYASLASSLNIDYLHNLVEDAGIRSITESLLGTVIEDSRITLLFKKLGYDFVIFPSEFYVTNRNRHADYVFRRAGLRMTEFDRVLLNTTMFRPLWGGTSNQRARRLYAFENIPRVADIDAPTFAFIHIVMPHPPYVFDARGGLPRGTLFEKEHYTSREYGKLYTDQITYLNKRMEMVIDAIFARSDREPIIIIQGDHGFVRKLAGKEQPSVFEKSSILNAYYLPGEGATRLYPSISPANTFRVILNHYFGQHFEILDDVTYRSVRQAGRVEFRLARRSPRDGGGPPGPSSETAPGAKARASLSGDLRSNADGGGR